MTPQQATDLDAITQAADDPERMARLIRRFYMTNAGAYISPNVLYLHIGMLVGAVARLSKGSIHG